MSLTEDVHSQNHVEIVTLMKPEPSRFRENIGHRAMTRLIGKESQPKQIYRCHLLIQGE